MIISHRVLTLRCAWPHSRPLPLSLPSPYTLSSSPSPLSSLISLSRLPSTSLMPHFPSLSLQRRARYTTRKCHTLIRGKKKEEEAPSLPSSLLSRSNRLLSSISTGACVLSLLLLSSHYTCSHSQWTTSINHTKQFHSSIQSFPLSIPFLLLLHCLSLFRTHLFHPTNSSFLSLVRRPFFFFCRFILPVISLFSPLFLPFFSVLIDNAFSYSRR